MVTAPNPTISCGLTEVPILVYATKNIGGVAYPVAGADVKLRLGAALPFLPMPEKALTTDIKGVAQTCITKFQYVEANIMKSNEDFGTGRGNWYRIGSFPGGSGSYTFLAEAKVAPPTPPPLPVITLPPLPVIAPPPTPAQVCEQVMTTVDSGYPNHPSEITDFAAPFYVYLRGIKEVCRSDPTNPAFIKKVPKGTKGTITLGNLSSDFYLTDDGIADLDLSKMMNLPSLAAVSPAVTLTVTPTPVVIVQPTKPSECERTGRIGRPGVYLVSLYEVQNYLNKCFPGGRAETVTGSWAGAFKITRGAGGKYPAGTYFWTVTWEDIKGLY